MEHKRHEDLPLVTMNFPLPSPMVGLQSLQSMNSIGNDAIIGYDAGYYTNQIDSIDDYSIECLEPASKALSRFACRRCKLLEECKPKTL